MPQFRLCDDPSLVAKITTAGYAPTARDYAQLEACFQRGLLRCDGVDGNDCEQVSDCMRNPDWEACEDPGQYLHCRDENGVGEYAWACVNTAEACAQGKTARYRLKIPETTAPSAHTVMSFRWDTYINNEVLTRRPINAFPPRRRRDAVRRSSSAART